MLYLGLDSSTAMASICLADDAGLIESMSSMNQKGHSEFMNGAIAEVLTRAQRQLTEIDYFCVSSGPGSFTGLRVAGNIAKSFAYTFNKKIITTDTLHILAHQKQSDSPWTICGINAYKNMIYFSIYYHSKLVKGPSVIEVSKLGTLLSDLNVKEIEFIGDGFTAYNQIFDGALKDKIIRPARCEDFPKASTLVEICKTLEKSGQTIDWNLWVPLYIRASSAEENLHI